MPAPITCKNRQVLPCHSWTHREHLAWGEEVDLKGIRPMESSGLWLSMYHVPAFSLLWISSGLGAGTSTWACMACTPMIIIASANNFRISMVLDSRIRTVVHLIWFNRTGWQVGHFQWADCAPCQPVRPITNFCNASDRSMAATLNIILSYNMKCYLYTKDIQRTRQFDS